MLLIIAPPIVHSAQETGLTLFADTRHLGTYWGSSRKHNLTEDKLIMVLMLYSIVRMSVARSKAFVSSIVISISNNTHSLRVPPSQFDGYILQ